MKGFLSDLRAIQGMYENSISRTKSKFGLMQRQFLVWRAVEQYNIREAEQRDIRAIFNLSNTPSVRNASFRSALILWEEHVEWFSRVLANLECVFLVADMAGQVAGQTRMSREDAQAVVSISVDPRFQGLGIGSSLYRAALADVQKRWQIAKIMARIRRSNAASIAFFKKIRFIPTSEELICGQQALVMVSIVKEAFHPICYQVPSASLTDHALLRHVRKMNRPVVLSTGMSTMEQIREAVKLLGTDDLVLMHATSTYPCEPAELNLRMVETLRREFSCPVGYSGHEVGLVPSAVAIALGACMVERHITLDRAMWGSDQAASVEPGGFERLVKYTLSPKQPSGME